MIVRKKVLSLGLLFSLIGVANIVQAYKATLYNNTPYLAEFKVEYVVGSKSKVVLPGEEKTISGPTLAAIVQRVEADVFEIVPREQQRQRYPGDYPNYRMGYAGQYREYIIGFKRVNAKSYKASHGRIGDSDWEVAAAPKVSQFKYRVRRTAG